MFCISVILNRSFLQKVISISKKLSFIFYIIASPQTDFTCNGWRMECVRSHIGILETMEKH